ncbi:hypothetical protein AZ602_01685 [Moraxella sp. RCAD0137]|nr:hypothetical protein AZ602_01685 [Moraxella sp. RCAD0137]
MANAIRRFGIFLLKVLQERMISKVVRYGDCMMRVGILLVVDVQTTIHIQVAPIEMMVEFHRLPRLLQFLLLPPFAIADLISPDFLQILLQIGDY